MTEISLTGDRMLAVLETVAAHGPASASEVSRLNGLNRTVAHRLLSTLRERSYVRLVPGGYVVGPAVLPLARAVEPELIAVITPELLALARETGETAVAHVVDGSDAVVVAQALGTRHLVRVAHEVGSRHALTLGASGRVLLAFRPREEFETIVRTAADPQVLRRELAEAAALGYAVSHDELQAGAHGVAAPLRGPDGFAQASIALVVPTARTA
ncbi:MAG: helix-turn-helix domain-containing protein, partial [Conexibacteraceae bacterium]|nr:helix-turn-helix domain-containing protein [Conexibacteraceae bacterium]